MQRHLQKGQGIGKISIDSCNLKQFCGEYTFSIIVFKVSVLFSWNIFVCASLDFKAGASSLGEFAHPLIFLNPMKSRNKTQNSEGHVVLIGAVF